MEDQPLIATTVRIRVDQLGLIKSSGINFSEWIREQFDNEFSEEDELRKQKKAIDAKLLILKERKKEAKKERKEREFKGEDAEKIKFFMECKHAIRRNPGYLPGQIKKYEFQFRETIKKEDFIKELNKY